jgi:hypothetical protein
MRGLRRPTQGTDAGMVAAGAADGTGGTAFWLVASVGKTGSVAGAVVALPWPITRIVTSIP